MSSLLLSASMHLLCVHRASLCVPFEPVSTTDMLKAKSHVPWRSERDISTPRQGNGQGTAGVCDNICRLSTAFGRTSQFRLLPVTTRTFSRVVFQNAATFGMCLIVLMAMLAADYTEYELTLQVKPVFLLLLCYVSIVSSSFHCMWARTLRSFFKFRNSYSKIFDKIFCLLSVRLPKREWNSPSSSFAQNTLRIQYLRFLLTFLLLKEGKTHLQLITSSSQLYMLTTVNNGGSRIQNKIP